MSFIVFLRKYFHFIFRNIHYIDFDGGEHYYTLTKFPTVLEKKVKLLNYFRNYMKVYFLQNPSKRESGQFGDTD